MARKFSKRSSLPQGLRPFFWSYNFDKLNPDTHPKEIVTQIINYGDIKDWSWLKKQYGQKNLSRIIYSLPSTVLRPRARKLAALIFKLSHVKNSPRSLN